MLFFEVKVRYLEGESLAFFHFLYLEEELSLNALGLGTVDGRSGRHRVALFQ